MYEFPTSSGTRKCLLFLLLLTATTTTTTAAGNRKDADYEYNTEANNKPQPSPITPGIQPSTVYTIHALPPDPPPSQPRQKNHHAGAAGSPHSTSTPLVNHHNPFRGGSSRSLGSSNSNDRSNIDDTGGGERVGSDFDYHDGGFNDNYNLAENGDYEDYYYGGSNLERNYLSAPVKEVEEGGVLRLKCKLEGLRNHSPVTVRWFLNDTEISELFAHRRLKFLPYKTPPRLRISRVLATDAGLYSGWWLTTDNAQHGWCNRSVVVIPPTYPPPLPLQSDNKVYDADYDDLALDESFSSSEVSLEETLAPRFSKKLTKFVVKPAGNVAELRCPARGSNLVTTWTKNGTIPTRKIGEVRLRKNMLKMENLVPQDAGNYTCTVTNQYGSINHTYSVDVIERLASRPILKQNLVNQTVVLGANATLECSVISDLPPFISWLKHPTQDSALTGGEINSLYVIKEGGQMGTSEDPQVLVLSNVSAADEGWYTCLAANSIGTSYSTAYLTIGEVEASTVLSSIVDEMNSVVLFSIVTVLMVVVPIVCIGLGCAFRKWKQEQKRSLELERSNKAFSQQIKKVIIERHENEHSEQPLLVPNVKIERCPSRRCLGTNNSNISSNNMSEYELPLDTAWELPRERLLLSDTLGEGAFGKVHKAELYPNDKKLYTTVAVKMLKEGHTDAELMDLVSEMEMMKIIGTHQNIINLIGCCTQDGPLYVVVEYAHYGNLRDFLRSSQPSALGYECAVDMDTRPCLTQRDLIAFAYQVARGMDYLAAKKCVHRDLAARNVLVCQDRVLKIADFGLARDIQSQDYYRKTSEGRLPVKWMAPEALFKRVYTSMSDVWAFGILLWEIMSLGGTPYPSVPSVEELFDILQRGHRMQKPIHCHQDTYNLMRNCWRYNAIDRPTFREILVALSKQLSMVTNEEYLDLSCTPHMDTPPSSYDSGVTTSMLPPPQQQHPY